MESVITDKPKIAHILKSIRELGPQEQLDVPAQNADLLRASLPNPSGHSVLELEGLGAEIWRGIDSQEYVNRERVAWDG